MSDAEQIATLREALGRAFTLIRAQQEALETAEALVKALRGERDR